MVILRPGLLGGKPEAPRCRFLVARKLEDQREQCLELVTLMKLFITGIHPPIATPTGLERLKRTFDQTKALTERSLWAMLRPRLKAITAL